MSAAALAGEAQERLAGTLAPPAVEVRKIWDKAPHNAFTDLVRHQERWWCVFREGQGHVSPDGAIRVITSKDGVTWESAALITSQTADLRDPKIIITREGKFMVNGAGALHDKSVHRHQSYVWFSENGREWSEPTAVGEPDYWLWRVTLHKDGYFGVGYDTRKDADIRFYQSRDGKKYETLVQDFYRAGQPNETSIVFLPDDTALCLLRRDAGNGLLGSAKAPYREWQWKDLGARIGGPVMLRLPDGRIVAAVRLYDGKVRTALCWIEPEKGKLTEFLAVPSGGDTSYPGLVWHEGVLWMSYYSSHEGKTAIYLAKVKLGKAESKK